jgi:hypothetical protein
MNNGPSFLLRRNNMGKNPSGIEKVQSKATDFYPIEVGHCNTNNLENKPVDDGTGS